MGTTPNSVSKTHPWKVSTEHGDILAPNAKAAIMLGIRLDPAVIESEGVEPVTIDSAALKPGAVLALCWITTLFFAGILGQAVSEKYLQTARQAKSA